MASDSNVPSDSFKNLPEPEKMALTEYIWENCNDIIEYANCHRIDAEKNSRLRKELFNKRTNIYGVILNFPARRDGFKFMKIGSTGGESLPGTGNRMENVMKKIKRQFPRSKSSLIFCLSIGPHDTDGTQQVENRVRNFCGVPLEPDQAKCAGLPIPTEWVLTQQDYITSLRTLIRKEKANRDLSTDIFNDQGAQFIRSLTSAKYATIKKSD